MFRIALRTILAGRRQVAALVVAVAISVGFVAATLTLTALVRTTVESANDSRLERVDWVLRSKGAEGFDQFESLRARLPVELLQPLQGMAKVRNVGGVIEGAATVMGGNGTPLAEQFGSATTVRNWLGNTDLDGAVVLSGRAPVGESEMLLDAGSVSDGGFQIGDQVTVDFPSSSRTLQLVGIAGPVASVAADSGADDSGPADSDVQTTGPRFVALTEAATRAVLNKPDGFDQILLTAQQGATDAVGTQLKALDLAGVEVRSAEAILRDQRAATRTQITSSVIAEAILVGVIGSVLGVAGGWLLAFSTRSLLAERLTLPGGPMSFDMTTAFIGLCTGCVATLAAAAVPAHKAGSIPPITALRGAMLDESHTARRRRWIGAALFLGGVSLIGIILTDTASLGLGGIGAGSAALFVSFALGGPALVKPVLGFAGRPAEALRGIAAKLGVRNAIRNPERTAVVTAALSVGIALVMVITGFEASVRHAASSAGTNQLTGIDLIIDSPVGLAPTLVEEISAVSGVTAATPVKQGVMSVLNLMQDQEAVAPRDAQASNGEQKFLIGLDLRAALKMVELDGLQPPIADLEDNEVIVHAKSAAANGWKVGDTVRAQFATGELVDLRIAATFQNRVGIDVEYITNLNTAARTQASGAAPDLAIWATLAPRQRPAATKAVADRLTLVAPAAKATTVDQYVAKRLRGITSLMNLLILLVGVSVIVALIGVSNAVALSVRERQNEITRLRALGTTRAQIHEAIGWETLLIAVCGSLLGIVTGSVLSVGFILALNEEGLTPVLSPVAALLIAVGGALAVVIAAARPARAGSKAVMPTSNA